MGNVFDKDEKASEKSYYTKIKVERRVFDMEFLLLAGGLVVIIIPVVISVVSAVVSGVAAAVDDEED